MASSDFSPSVNNQPPLHAKSNAENGNPVALWADPTTHRLLVDANISLSASDIQIGAVEIKNGTDDTRLTVTAKGSVNAAGVFLVDGSGSQITTFAGTEYTEGGTDTTITGTAIMWEDASDTLRAVSASKPLPVDIQDSTLAVTQSGNWTVRLSDGTDTADILDLTNSNPLTVAIVDGSGDQITSFGGGTQYAVDAALGATPTGTLAIAIRDDATSTLTPVEGDAIGLRVNARGALWVDLETKLDKGNDSILVYANTAKDASGTSYVPLIDTDGHLQVDVLSGGGAGTQYTEDAAAAGDPVGNALIMVRKDTLAALTSADGDNVAARGTDKGELYVKHVDAIPITDNGGNLSIDDGGNTITVDGTVAVTNAGLTELAAAINASSQMDINIAASGATLTVASHAVTNAGTFAVQATVAAGATNIAKAEDAANADADVGVPAMMVRKATPANLSGTDGDYEFLQGAAGRLWVDASGVTLTVGSHAVTNAGTFAVQVDGSALTSLQLIDNIALQEDAAHSTGDYGVQILAVRQDTQANLGADGDYTPLSVDGSGALRVTGGGGGTEYTEDGAAPANPVGGSLMVVRDDQLATVTEAEGDWSTLKGTSKGALWVALADASGDPITSFGGGTQYTEDAAAAANPVGTAINLIRADSLAGVTTTDGDNLAARGTDKGELYVKHVDAIPVTDNGGALTVDGTVAVTQSGTWDEVGINDSGNSITVDNAQLSVVGSGTEAAAMRVTIATDSTGVLSVDDNGGNLSIDDGGNSITVDNGGTFAVQATVAAGATTIAKAEDVASADADVGVPALAVRKATPANTSGTDGDYEFLQMSAGRLWASATIDAALPAGTNAIGKLAANSGVDIGDVDVTSAVISSGTLTTLTTLTGAGIAHDGADSGNPHKIGAKAETSPKGITVVADGDRTDLYADSDGMLMVKLNTSGADVVSEAVSNTDGSSTAFTNFSAVASTKNYITSYHVFRTDAGTTPIYVDFRDGTAGSVLYRAVIPPNGGSNSPTCAGPALFKTSANTALAFDVSAATTTVYISVSGYQSKV